MTRIGGYVFPSAATHVQTKLVEANSKVRKEVRIRSLVRAASPSLLEDQLQELQAAVELFDQGGATLSLQPGQIHYGRRRSLEIAPHRRSLAAGVDLLAWTRDRYARSEALHQNEAETYLGKAHLSVFNRGNWNSPAQFTIEAKSAVELITIETEDETFTLNGAVNPGETVLVDSENHRVEIDGRNEFASCNQQFPILAPGANALRVSLSPNGAEAGCRVAFRDVWI